MKEYLIKYYLDDNEKNPFNDTEIEIIKANNERQAVEKLGAYLRKQINENQYSKVSVVKYRVTFNYQKIIMYLQTNNYVPKSKDIIDTFIIESIEELR